MQAQRFVTALGEGTYVNDLPISLRGVSVGNQVWSNVALPDHIREADYIRMKSMHMNVVRFYLNYLTFEDDAKPYIYKQSGFDYLNKHINWARKHGIYLILNIHVPPGGFQSQCNGKKLWTDPQNQKRTCKLWKELAKRFENEPQIAAYDLVNEPTPLDSAAQWKNLAQRIVDSIRTVDKNHLIYVERTNAVNCNWNNDANNNLFLITDPVNNTGYTFHFYSPFEYTHQLFSWVNLGDGGKYPDPSKASFPNDISWFGGNFEGATPQGTTPWTYYEGGKYQVTNDSVIFAQPTFNASRTGNGTAWLDEYVIKEYDETGLFLRDILVHDVEDDDGWDNMWSRNQTGSVTYDEGGHTHAARSCLKFTGSTDDANAYNWTQKFPVVKTHYYQINGWIKTENLPTGAFVKLNLGFYISKSNTKPKIRDKNYLAAELEKYIAWGKANNVSLYLGEFGAGTHCFKKNKGGEIWLRDMIHLLNDNKINFTYHAYREDSFGLYGGQSGPINESTATPAVQIFKDFIDKKSDSVKPDSIPLKSLPK